MKSFWLITICFLIGMFIGYEGALFDVAEGLVAPWPRLFTSQGKLNRMIIPRPGLRPPVRTPPPPGPPPPPPGLCPAGER